MLELWFDSKEESLSVRHFSVREALSELFEVTVVALSPNEDLDLESIAGKPAGLLVTWGNPPEPRVWSGICTELTQLAAEPTGLSTYRVRIAPDLWLATRRVDHRVFEHLTIPEIVKKVLSRYRIDPRLELTTPHDAHEYRVQLGETDFAFVSRLLEEEGISFFFTQAHEDNGYRSELVLSDAPGSRDVRRGWPIHVVDNPNHDARREFVTKVRLGHATRPGRVALRDWDFVRPDLRLEGEAKLGVRDETSYEQYRFRPSALIKDRDGKPHAATEDEASRAAKRWLDALRQGRRRVRFESNALDLAVGVVFAMDGHPRKDLGPDHKLVMTEAFYEGSIDAEWKLTGAAAFAKDPIVPERRTPKPVVHGLESAIVVGEKGEEVHTDGFGRVRVQFHWDREGQYDQGSSCWVRVSQGWAGSAWGMIALPRVGHEVLVDFFEGDPDQPIITGRVYNNRTKVPYKLPDHARKATWKSSSSPDSEGFSEILLDDAAGKELVYFQAQRDLSKLVKADETERTGLGRTQIVGANRTAIVGATDSLLVGAKHTVGVAKKPGEDGSPPPPPTTFFDMVDEKIRLTTTKATSLLEGPEIALTADGMIVIQSGGNVILEGAKVLINSEDVTGKPPSFEMKRAARAGKPEGRVLDAIKKAFGAKPKPAETPQGKKELVVPHRTQVGGTCGLAALGMVTDFWKAKDSSNKAPSGDELLATAQKKGWTDTGGMWEHDLPKLAKEYGYAAEYKNGASMADLKKSIDAGVPALVTFSVDGVGEPKTGTDRGHWAVIKGYFTKDGKDYVVGSHGWSDATTKVWDAKQFEQSWASYGKGEIPPGAKMVTVHPALGGH
jgi:type VI secretion system secreted protein VgrG